MTWGSRVCQQARLHKGPTHVDRHRCTVQGAEAWHPEAEGCVLRLPLSSVLQAATLPLQVLPHRFVSTAPLPGRKGGWASSPSGQYTGKEIISKSNKFTKIENNYSRKGGSLDGGSWGSAGTQLWLGDSILQQVQPALAYHHVPQAAHKTCAVGLG